MDGRTDKRKIETVTENVYSTEEETGRYTDGPTDRQTDRMSVLGLREMMDGWMDRRIDR